MFVSYNWLQSYFKKKLPPAEKVAELLTMHVFEVESVEKKEGDFVLDVKVLPDRAHYAFSHRGIAYELAAIIGEEILFPELLYQGPTLKTPKVGPLRIAFKIEDSKLCPRYMGRMIENIAVRETPSWMKERLEAVGQRAINPIVDITNYVLLDTGQPLHAFDADKLKGRITVRLAKPGEHIELLSGKVYSSVLENIRIYDKPDEKNTGTGNEKIGNKKINSRVKLDGSQLVIADDEGPLVIAGIKGGKRAEVTEKTTRIILEAANFNPIYVRKTSTILGIKTDSSKRFENGVSPYWAEIGMNEASALTAELSPRALAGEVFDSAPQKRGPKGVVVSLKIISDILGISINVKEIIETLERLDFNPKVSGDSLTLRVPIWRQDILNVFDVAEEVGRIAGYEKIAGRLLQNGERPAELNKTDYYCEKIKVILSDAGFSEVQTSSFQKTGEIEIEKSLASDKNFLRKSLAASISDALAANLYNVVLFGTDRISIFEIGTVFGKAGEHLSLCAGITHTSSRKGKTVNEEIREVRELLVSALGAPITTVCTIDDTGGVILLSGKPIGSINEVDGVMEINLNPLIKALPEPKVWDLSFPKPRQFTFTPFSVYPFIVRDVAVYVKPDDSFNEISNLVQELKNENKLPHLSIAPKAPFDEFINAKTNKKSFAFRLIFQADDRTLTDAEVNTSMGHIYKALRLHSDWQVR